MKCFTIYRKEVEENIEISTDPYPRVVLGEGGNKKATWIAIGSRDASHLIQEDEGKKYIRNVGIVFLKERKKHIVVCERKREDRVLVLFKWKSGYRGRSDILSEESYVVGYDKSWHSGRGSLGETAELLVIMNKGEMIIGKANGRRMENTHCVVEYEGNGIFKIKTGDENILIDETIEEQIEV